MADLRLLITKRGQIKAKMTRFKTYLDSVENTNDYSQLQSRLEKFKETWSEFEAVQSEIELSQVSEDSTSDQDQERELFENLYFDLITRTQPLNSTPLNTLHSPKSIATEGNGSQIKLPTIKLPTFSGKYEDWLHFSELFQSLIGDNSTLSEVQKLHYLKSSVSDQASSLIESLELSEANYKTAWQLLTERFQNKRLIVNRHVLAIHNIYRVEKESSQALRHLLDTVQKHIRSLQTLGQPVEHWDTLIVHIVTKKLDPITLRQWEGQLTSSELPTYPQLVKFLENKCQTLELIEPNFTSVKSHNFKPQNLKKPPIALMVNNNTKCPSCTADHKLFQCMEFKSLAIPDRIQKVRMFGLCMNCLSKAHQVKDCKSGGCRMCNKKHNTLLHLLPDNNQTSKTEHQVVGLPQASLASNSNRNHILLSTAVVEIEDNLGHKHECRVLLDSASQSNFITAKMVRKLNITKMVDHTPIIGIGNSQSKTSHSVDCTIHSIYNSYSTKLHCLVLDKITNDLPSLQVDISSWSLPKSIKLADVNFNTPAPIDMLIGAQLFFNILSIGQIRPHKSGPVFQKTAFGWVASGSVSINENKSTQSLCHLSTTEKIHHQLKQFWELEGCEGDKNQGAESDNCEEFFRKTTKREQDGRFVVTLPKKSNISDLGESQEVAMSRFIQMERNLSKSLELGSQYRAFMKEYKELGHMELIEDNSKGSVRENKTYYIPHLPVIRTDSSTTKLRVVFDASSKTTTGLSLNDSLHVGPNIQRDIFSIICRFRAHKFVITGDIEKMYRQIKIAPEDEDLQRILWRDDPTQPIQIYKLKTVTYGTSPAPFLAIRTLRQLASDGRYNFPKASSIVENDFYMDDVMTGANSVQELYEIYQQLTELMKSAGFNLRKWCSNSSEILESIPIEDRQHPNIINLENEPTKVLGMLWNQTKDTFQYRVKKHNPSIRINKRSILSEIASIYDPLGLLGPVITKAKLFMQEIWKLNLTWDESLSIELHTSWMQFRDKLDSLTGLKIPRNVLNQSDMDNTQLHGFCDASENAYGACIYLRHADRDGTISVELLCSKSRVAPLKGNTIPKLELCAALLLAKLVKKVLSVLNHLNFESCTLWSDSTITLAWIKEPPKQWKVFVENRVREIQNMTKECATWKYIRSTDNPADHISRGLNPSRLLTCKSWWHGPSWMNNDLNQWPLEKPNTLLDIPEIRKMSSLTLVSTSQAVIIDPTKWSSLSTLNRVTAYCFRFINNLRSRSNRTTGSLQVQELESAFNYLLKNVQQQHFKEEYGRLIEGKPIKQSSHIKSLQPFIDNKGLIRVGGRLRNSSVDTNYKHPIILPSDNHVTELIAKREHKRHLHAGPQLLLAVLRHQFWPLKGRHLVRRVVHGCITCFKAKPKISQQQMGDLPASRTTPSRPFTHTGIDFCGPVLIKNSKRKNSPKTKSYIAIFVCFATKAMHLELVSDLTSEAFIAALKRFIARRGICSKIYCDNGTNFVGAKRELAELQKMLRNELLQKKLIDFATNQTITWHFIPPRSPHFGGLWEAGVKSVKQHLKRVIGNASLTFECMYTTLVMIEACLNSRPITPLSNDPSDLQPLTPGHFLIGQPLTSLPEPNLTLTPYNRLSQWQRAQQLLQHFWARWSREYLTTMQQRSKWTAEVDNIEKGQLVIIKEDNLPPMQWSMARVIDVQPGSDGRVRVATVRTATNTLKRATNRLCLLPIKDDNFL